MSSSITEGHLSCKALFSGMNALVLVRGVPPSPPNVWRSAAPACQNAETQIK